MSPACIAQLFGLAIIFSRSAFARDATGAASRQTVAIAMAGGSHSALKLFITPPLVIVICQFGDARRSQRTRGRAMPAGSVCLPFDKVNLLGTRSAPRDTRYVVLHRNKEASWMFVLL